MQTALERGVPPHKLILGIPFYGRDLRQPGEVMTYGDISQKAKEAGRLSSLPGSDTPIPNNSMWINSMDTVRDKVRWADAQGLGGVMIWELGQDSFDDTSLLLAIHLGLPQSKLHKKAKKARKRVKKNGGAKKTTKKKKTASKHEL